MLRHLGIRVHELGTPVISTNHQVDGVAICHGCYLARHRYTPVHVRYLILGWGGQASELNFRTQCHDSPVRTWNPTRCPSDDTLI